MAFLQNDAVFPEDGLDYESQGDEEEEEEDDDDDVVPGEPDDDDETEPSPSTSSALTAVTVAVPGSGTSNGNNAPIPTAAATTIVASSDSKRQRSEQNEEKKPLDDSRRLFQRLWMDEDEIGLLQGFLEYTTTQRGRGSSHHNDTALFYDQIKSKLQLGFNKNQLVEKLRRLKKYRNVLNKIDSGKDFSFKSPHDQATFEISRKIWSNTPPIGATVEDNNALEDDEINLNPNPNPNPNFSHSMSLKNEANSAEKRTLPSRKRSRSRSGMRTEEKRELNDGSALNKDNNYISNTNDNNYDHNNDNNNCNCSRRVQGLIGETLKSCLSALLMEILSGPFGARGFGVGGIALNSLPLSLNWNLGSGEVVDEKWRKQHILELEVYSKRLGLVQDEIKAAMEELQLAGAGG